MKTRTKRSDHRWPLLAWSLALAAAASAAPKVDFNREVRPLLSENCFACHGPDAKKVKGGLRLDLREVATKPLNSGATAIMPGRTGESELVRRIFATDPDEQMPPAESHKALTAAQKDLLKRWIAEGAEYRGHWAYELPKKVAVPAGQNPIDFLVRKRLKELSLEPSPETDRPTLARRLHFDLVGLPPKPEEVAVFERDRSRDAYEKLVDRLLASPHYGERMAIGWLDVVRFADTIGYHSDNPRNIWPYRDYVIRSFNRNTPFDRFTREQLAGDLLPDPTLEQKVASGFNRLLLTTEEGGAQPKDYEARHVTDRVRAVGAVWLGQTIGCAQCHDHKFDPITTRDFYSLGAFFADVKRRPSGGAKTAFSFPPRRKRANSNGTRRKLRGCKGVRRAAPGTGGVLCQRAVAGIGRSAEAACRRQKSSRRFRGHRAAHADHRARPRAAHRPHPAARRLDERNRRSRRSGVAGVSGEGRWRFVREETQPP